MALLSLVACTENERVKKWGGTSVIELPIGKKLINITWKGEQLWYITRPMRKDEKPETYRFHEESNFGLLEGTYIVKESRTPTTSYYLEQTKKEREWKN